MRTVHSDADIDR